MVMGSAKTKIPVNLETEMVNGSIPSSHLTIAFVKAKAQADKATTKTPIKG